jgi:hypothetical protein
MSKTQEQVWLRDEPVFTEIDLQRGALLKKVLVSITVALEAVCLLQELMPADRGNDDVAEWSNLVMDLTAAEWCMHQLRAAIGCTVHPEFLPSNEEDMAAIMAVLHRERELAAQQ